jgi:hypothetical protein
MKTYYKNIISLILLIFISCSGGSSSDTAFQYLTPEEIDVFLNEIKLNYPNITSIETLGDSQSGDHVIKALVISDNPGTDEGEPAVRLTGGIHGNEKMSVELMIRLIEYLTSNYNSDPAVKSLVDNRYICIIPVLNPDGLAANSRYNSRGVDLNRNFDDHWYSDYHHGESAFSEKETAALRDFSPSGKFNLSITYHVGAVLVNLPFDYQTEPPAENDLIRSYATIYTKANSSVFLSNPDLYVDLEHMVDGTINGGEWYIITGSLQDWSYTKTGCLDLTIEIAKRNPDTEEDVQKVFMYNKDSLMAYIESASSYLFSGL